jgi:hypothetical protein
VFERMFSVSPTLDIALQAAELAPFANSYACPWLMRALALDTSATVLGAALRSMWNNLEWPCWNITKLAVASARKQIGITTTL